MTPAPDRPFGVLIHGAGWVAGQHAAAFSNNPHARILAVSSHSKSSADRLIDCLLRGVDSHCNLADAVKTHEVVSAALECYPADYVQDPDLPWFQPVFPLAGTRHALEKGRPLTLHCRLWIRDAQAPAEKELRDQWHNYQK